MMGETWLDDLIRFIKRLFAPAPPLVAPAGATMYISYTVYSLWRSGDADDKKQALARVQGGQGGRAKQTFPLKLGSAIHRQFERETRQTGYTPRRFNASLPVVAVEQRLERRLSDWLILSGQADALTQSSVIDYKTTRSRQKTARDFVATGQLEIYCFLFQRSIGEIWCWNSTLQEPTRVRKQMSSASIQAIIADVYQVAEEIRQVLEKRRQPWWRN